MTDLILSLRSHFVDLILDGTKPIELRKPMIKAALKKQGCRAFLYATSPVKKIIGDCTIVSQYFDDAYNERMIKLLGDKYIRTVCEDACVSVDEYYAKWRSYEIYTVHNPRRFDEPIELCDLGLERPPQSFCYLQNEKAPLCDSCVDCVGGTCLLKDCSIRLISPFERRFCGSYDDGSKTISEIASGRSLRMLGEGSQ